MNCHGVSALLALDFPFWLRAAHYANLLFLTLLIRSGLEIFSAHPKLYWNDDCRPGSEWFNVNWLLLRPSALPDYYRRCVAKRQRRRTTRLAAEVPPAGRLSLTDTLLGAAYFLLLLLLPAGKAEPEIWTSSDEEVAFPSWLALPGQANLGLGRHWHFLGDLAWILNGIAYYCLLFATGEYHRLIPDSWAVFPGAAHAFAAYARFTLVEAPGRYNDLQMLVYAGVVFGLAPLTIATGLAMSPSLTARFPVYLKIFRGRQAARSIHFLCLLGWCIFIVVHVAMVAAHGFLQETAKISLGITTHPNLTLTAAVVGLGLFAILLFHIVATLYSLRRPRLVAARTGAVIDVARRALFGHSMSRQHYRARDISPYFRVNGRPPKDPQWLGMAERGFGDYRLQVAGLVGQPLSLSLADLRSLPRRRQITKHCCIQGWSAVAEWGGVELARIVELCRPLPEARWIAFFAWDNKSLTEPDPSGPGYFYGTIHPRLARDPQTLLAYEMNRRPLPLEHGAPLRLRVETQLGFMMVKYIRMIEFIDDYRKLGLGQGGWREDYQFYSPEASI
jgi:DMSO/TMAO reductase YedYZ molybdopterin-dependent catalytic subunit/thiosulfate reductase cytochrome b subunit